MTAERIVIVGADAAGMSAAHQALRTGSAHGRPLEVIVLETTSHTSYSACGIPYWIAGDVSRGGDLVARTPAEHRAAGIDLRTGVTAVGLDLDARVVATRDGDGEVGRVDFDQVLLATGAEPIVPPWAAVHDGRLPVGAGVVKDLDDGARWLEWMAASADAGRRQIVIAGAGYIGVEMAEAALRRGFEVTVVTRSRVMGSLDRELSERVVEALTTAGVRVVEDVEVDGLGVAADGRVREVIAGEQRYPCDLLVLALGVRPRAGLGSAAGLPTGEYAGLLPDDRGLVAPGVWAAGDCCETVHRITGQRVFLPLGTHANKQGRVVGTNLGGGRSHFAGVLGTAITRFAHDGHEIEIARTGLSEAEATAASREVVSLITEGTTASGYMPEAAPLAIKVVAERTSRRLLGMQIVGGAGAGKRIDTAATALWGEMTVDDLAAMDLAYAPPFATAWEIVQIAARRVADRL